MTRGQADKRKAQYSNPISKCKKQLATAAVTSNNIDARVTPRCIVGHLKQQNAAKARRVKLSTAAQRLSCIHNEQPLRTCMSLCWTRGKFHQERPRAVVVVDTASTLSVHIKATGGFVCRWKVAAGAKIGRNGRAVVQAIKLTGSHHPTSPLYALFTT